MEVLLIGELVGSVNDGLGLLYEGGRYESADSPTDINRRQMLETEKRGANLVAFMPDHTKDFSDFAHRCVCAFAVVGVNRT